MAADVYQPMRLDQQRSLKNEVADVSGLDVDCCLECGKCSGGCSTGHLFEYTPRQIVQLVKLGARDTLMRMEALSVCVGCRLCHDRCPVGIDVASMVDYFRERAHEEGIPVTHGDVSLFNELFLRQVYAKGRISEAPLMVRFNFGTRRKFRDVGLGARLWRKGKLRLLNPSPRVRDLTSVRRLFKERPAAKTKVVE